MPDQDEVTLPDRGGEPPTNGVNPLAIAGVRIVVGGRNLADAYLLRPEGKCRGIAGRSRSRMQEISGGKLRCR